MAKEKLTNRQKKVLKAIKAYIKKERVPPTRLDISIDLGCHPNAVQGHVEALERKGWIEIKPGMARGIVVL